jgi:hypothetical protein
VREQVEARGITMPSEIAWADIAVKNRLPHMSKERFRRRGEGLREASLLERYEHPLALKTPRSTWARILQNPQI